MPQKKPSKAKRPGKCHVCGDTGHYARDCKEKKSESEEVALQDTTGKCHVCGETGHYARECKDKKSDTVKVVLQGSYLHSHNTGRTNMPESTNKASKAKRTGKCHVCGDTGHYARDCKERKSDSVKEVLQDTTRKCHVCGETGHYARECKDKKSQTVKVVLKETIGSGTRSNKKAEGWYLFSRSTAHVCYSKDMFVDYNPMKDHEVILDNNDHVDVAGIGTVVIRFTTGKVLTLSNVLHIPQISKCLVSVSKLDDLGYSMSFGGGGCVIKNGHEVIGKGYIEDGVYRLSLLEEGTVKRVVHDETIGLLVANEHPEFVELTKARARGWYLLTRCTVHVCNSRNMFADYQPVTGHEVVLENNSHVEVVGFGTVKLQLTSGKVLTLENVFHIPEIIKCCISVRKLTKMGFTVGFWGEGCDIKKGHEIVGNGYIEDELYRLSVVDEDRGADYNPMIDHEVNLDNNEHADVPGISTKAPHFTTGEAFTLPEVHCVPTLGCNVLSVSKLDEMGISMYFGGGECFVKQGHVVIGKGYKKDGLYGMSFMKELRIAKVVHNETIGLLIFNEHPELTKARARGWYLLTRCTVHVCNSRDMFVDYQPVTGHEVVLENNSHVDVVGFGTVKLWLTTGKVLTLKNVLHMPAIIKCCISVNKLMEMGFSLGFDADGCYVKKDQQIVGNGYTEDGLYRLSVIDERSGFGTDSL
ncbi:hypothetical protein CTI12_AA074830 [Artemisia annua]|uniref:CCHC-type domain-containing protein n=1 Tax=Artemisia annua TaxID=35608 RepID=A0A2U1Q3D4_ARTAN|nr:hypothetical protein CTI12_AA074830 [Artemisia annua]